MINTIYQLNPLAKSVKLVLSAAIFSSTCTLSYAEIDIGPSGINIVQNAQDTKYIINSGTVINSNSTLAPVIINDSIVATVTNDGSIVNSKGSSVAIDSISGKFINNNVISANEYGISANSSRAPEIVNNGMIEGGEAGIYISSSAIIDNSGTISSQTGSAAIVVDTQNTTITNGGNIIGRDKAVIFNNSGNQLTLKNNSAITGDIITSVAGNSITLLESGNEDSNFVSSGNGSGFSNLEMRGNEWTLGGNIDLVDTGAGDVLKVTHGKLILTGELNNTGNSLIGQNAELQLGDGTTTALFNGDTLTNNGTLIFDQQGNSDLSASITGAGNIIKTNDSTLTLSGNNVIAGTTTLNQGSTLITGTLESSTITVNNGALLATQGRLVGNLAINEGGTFSSWEGVSGNSGSSTNTVHGNVNNAGTLSLASVSNRPGTVMTIEGDYHGEGNSKIVMATEAAGDNSQTDHLAITQNSSGQSLVSITNAGGAGAQTINGIELISVGGISDATFALASPVTAGKWEYDLKKKNNNWYLVSEKSNEPDSSNGGTPPDDGGTAPGDGGTAPGDGGAAPGSGGNNYVTPPEVMTPETSAYLGNYMAAQQMFVHKRDDREALLPRGTEQNSGWMYVQGRYNESKVDGDRGSYDTTTHVFQLGSDLISRTQDNGEWHAGFMLGTGLSVTNADASYNTRSAKGHVSGYNIGLYSTWQEDPYLRVGSYVDSWISASWYDSWVKGDGLNRENYSSRGFAASVEAGHAWLLNSESERHWKVEPQGQVIFSYLDQNGHQESSGTKISTPDSNSVRTRLGVKMSNVDTAKPGAWQPWVAANWLNGAGMNDLQFNGETAYGETPDNRGQVEIGIRGDMNAATTISLRASSEWGERGYNAWSGHVLWNYRW